MGNQASSPKPGTKFQVIGAGLSRTGTASFSEALRILLDGPVYHCGTQATRGPPVEIQSLIKILQHWPPAKESDKSEVERILKERLNGFAAVTDMPANGLVPELLKIYPNAKVICTTRDPESWVKSMQVVQSASTMWFLRFVLFPLPGMRHFPDFIDAIIKQWEVLYGKGLTTESYDKHIAWLKKVVPEDRLVFFNVKDGWEPLCKALGKEIPRDIPFPNINDAKAIDKAAGELVQRGLIRWLMIFATLGAVVLSYRLM